MPADLSLTCRVVASPPTSDSPAPESETLTTNMHVVTLGLPPEWLDSRTSPYMHVRVAFVPSELLLIIFPPKIPNPARPLPFLPSSFFSFCALISHFSQTPRLLRRVSPSLSVHHVIARRPRSGE